MSSRVNFVSPESAEAVARGSGRLHGTSIFGYRKSNERFVGNWTKLWPAIAMLVGAVWPLTAEAVPYRMTVTGTAGGSFDAFNANSPGTRFNQFVPMGSVVTLTSEIDFDVTVDEFPTLPNDSYFQNLGSSSFSMGTLVGASFGGGTSVSNFSGSNNFFTVAFEPTVTSFGFVGDVRTVSLFTQIRGPGFIDATVAPDLPAIQALLSDVNNDLVFSATIVFNGRPLHAESAIFESASIRFDEITSSVAEPASLHLTLLGFFGLALLMQRGGRRADRSWAFRAR